MTFKPFKCFNLNNYFNGIIEKNIYYYTIQNDNKIHLFFLTLCYHSILILL